MLNFVWFTELNFLACQIVRGQYAPIVPQYSKGLRDLVDSCLRSVSFKPQTKPSILLDAPTILAVYLDLTADILLANWKHLIWSTE